MSITEWLAGRGGAERALLPGAGHQWPPPYWHRCAATVCLHPPTTALQPSHPPVNSIQLTLFKHRRQTTDTELQQPPVTTVLQRPHSAISLQPPTSVTPSNCRPPTMSCDHPSQSPPFSHRLTSTAHQLPPSSDHRPLTTPAQLPTPSKQRCCHHHHPPTVLRSPASYRRPPATGLQPPPFSHRPPLSAFQPRPSNRRLKPLNDRRPPTSRR